MRTPDISSYQDPLSLSEICEYNKFEDITHKYEGEIVEVEFVIPILAGSLKHQGKRTGYMRSGHGGAFLPNVT